ncbi:MAG TPA: hypothetical protein VMU80_15380 [Bryobacteraceae bacterium]|nr:hypothetical protein [Bryobacteraceae bacterium]
MDRRAFLSFLGLAAPLWPAATSDYETCLRKFALIEQDRLRPGSHVLLTQAEINAYARHEIASVAPEGVRSPRLNLGPGTATASALIDFGKLRRAEGKPPGLLMGYLLDGERPVTVTARIRSSDGTARVDVESVEISGVVIEGRMLDFLVNNYLLPDYPQAKIGQPFELGHRIERLEVQPAVVGVFIGH